LTHDAKFTGHGELNGASAFLMSLSDTQVVAVTARHLFAWFGSSLPNLKLSLIDDALDTWKLHARNQPEPNVNLAGLLGTPTSMAPGMTS